MRGPLGAHERSCIAPDELLAFPGLAPFFRTLERGKSLQVGDFSLKKRAVSAAIVGGSLPEGRGWGNITLVRV